MSREVPLLTSLQTRPQKQVINMLTQEQMSALTLAVSECQFCYCFLHGFFQGGFFWVREKEGGKMMDKKKMDKMLKKLDLMELRGKEYCLRLRDIPKEMNEDTRNRIVSLLAAFYKRTRGPGNIKLIKYT